MYENKLSVFDCLGIDKEMSVLHVTLLFSDGSQITKKIVIWRI